jgi:hypothetical protein
MTMVMLTMLFLLEQRLYHKSDISMMSSADVMSLLNHFLPRRDITEDEVIRQMEVRHRKRESATKSAYKKQSLTGLLDGMG